MEEIVKSREIKREFTILYQCYIRKRCIVTKCYIRIRCTVTKCYIRILPFTSSNLYMKLLYLLSVSPRGAYNHVEIANVSRCLLFVGLYLLNEAALGTLIVVKLNSQLDTKWLEKSEYPTIQCLTTIYLCI